MARNDHPLFDLDAGRRHRLSCDDLQWIIERGNLQHARPDKDSGYRGISFVCTHKYFLWRGIHADEIETTPEARAFLDALPDHFLEFRNLVRALGIDGARLWLSDRAKALAPLPEVSRAT